MLKLIIIYNQIVKIDIKTRFLDNKLSNFYI